MTDANKKESFFHLHLVSDATGETLIAAGRAVAAQYTQSNAIEHVYPLVRNQTQMEKVIESIDREPGIVLYTIVDPDLGQYLEKSCHKFGTPCISVLQPIFHTFNSYLGKPNQQKVGAQHALDNDYFKRIEALNFTMAYDDGVLPEDVEEADIVLIGISRTSKTPTSIYLANRGVKTINIPLIPGIPISPVLLNCRRPLVVALIATTDQIYHVRQNRMLGINAIDSNDSYTNRATIAEELSQTRKLCKKNNWSMIDVTRKSIEETAAAILEHHSVHIKNIEQLENE